MQAIDTNYQETLDYLFARLPMFSRIGAAALKPDLNNIRALCDALGNPQLGLKCIHIAGTNGKGSTSHMLAAIFQKAGYRTGLYTSPHLVDFRERIRVNGLPVSKEFVVQFVKDHAALIEHIQPSFFEITVAMAFVAFRDMKVAMAIIETGLGGRLDSTNIILPELSIITNISLDHTDLLGHTITAIAGEKAGIIKQGVPVVIGPCVEEAAIVFRETAQKLQSSLVFAKNTWQLQMQPLAKQKFQEYQAVHQNRKESWMIQTDLSGNYQEENIATVLTAIEVLESLGWKVSVELLSGALKHVKTDTGLIGRWDIRQQDPLIIADVGHNQAGLHLVMEHWNAIQAREKHIILGFVRDKDISAALNEFPRNGHYHFCAADMPRALPAVELAAIARQIGLDGVCYASVSDAVHQVRALLNMEDALLITGSFFIVGEALAVLGDSGFGQ